METKTQFSLAAALLAVVALTPDASALECGDTIYPGEKVKLDGHVGPCPAVPGGITVIGPATLDLNGFTVWCEGSHIGVRLQGERGVVKNGTVEDCPVGVMPDGEGRHRVKHVTVEKSGVAAFLVYSDRNLLERNQSLQSWVGFRIEGDRNRLRRNRASQAATAGFLIRGYRNLVARNLSVDSHRHGFEVEPGQHKILRNGASVLGGFDFFGSSIFSCANTWRHNSFDTAHPACIE